jgi:hypothetical protein
MGDTFSCFCQLLMQEIRRHCIDMRRPVAQGSSPALAAQQE